MSQKTIDTIERTSVKRKQLQKEHSTELVQNIQFFNLPTAEPRMRRYVKVECRDIKNMTELAKRGLNDRTYLL